MIKRGSVVQMTSPARGVCEVLGLCDDFKSYLVMVKQEDFTETGWETLVKLHQGPKGSRKKTGLKSQAHQGSRIRLVLQLSEKYLVHSTIIDEGPSPREEILRSKVLPNMRVFSNKDPNKIYIIDEIRDERVRISRESDRSNWWWTTARSIRRNFTILE